MQISYPSYFVKPAVVVSLTFVLLFSCKQEPEPLPMERMSQILTELYIAESYVQYLPKDSTRPEPSKIDSLKKFTAAVFAENRTDETEFKRSIDWYKSRPELLDSVYQQVLTDLSIWQTKIDRK
ncbi:hypothetical protein EMGBS15_04090 [Filimonas sp.]|nr:hypothetical protein EMGBS15_04090 [Filimonas sp.]